MDTVLIVLGVLGLGAIIISAYVFTVAARNNVDNDHKQRRGSHSGTPRIARNSTDRRSGRPVQFPLKINGTLISADRRHLPDRRAAAA